MAIFKQNQPKTDRKLFTWDSFLEYYNQRIDSEIISFSRANNQFYYGGKCTISAKVNEDEFSKKTYLIVVSVLYFKDQFTKKVIERTIKSKFDYQEFNKDKETLAQLRSIVSKPMEVNIDSPVIESEVDQ
ncbi:hypothetical protein [Ruminococcus sp.]|uniref:hypothetical protein n=1 Tax=Ruminococcus sp. TaxID=41978 RepID=UPI0025CCA6C6|nr:hypothetical protein [Ruminococcus sp.]MCR4639048.1 hypothetical protein [Ruminococcus sp.]